MGAVLQSLVEASTAAGGARLRVERAGDAYHVIPAETQNVVGAWVRTASILDAFITIPEQELTDLEIVGTICAAVTEATDVRIVLGMGLFGGPQNFAEPPRKRFSANNERARDVLFRALQDIRPGVSWLLFNGPGMPEYVLNFSTAAVRPHAYRLRPLVGRRAVRSARGPMRPEARDPFPSPTDGRKILGSSNRSSARGLMMTRTLLAASAALLLSAAAHAQSMPPEIPYDSVPDFFKLPENMYFGEVAGIAVNSQKHIFVLSRGNTTGPGLWRRRGAAAGVRPERQVRARDRQEPLRVVVLPHGARRPPRQHLGHGQGLGHGRAVRSGRPREDGVRPQARGIRRERASARASAAAAAAGRRPVPPGHRRRVGLAGQHLHQRRLHQLARREVRQGRQLGRVVRRVRPGRGQFNTLHSIAVDAQDRIYVADRGNRRIQVLDTAGKVLDVFTIDVPVPPNAPVAIGNRPAETGRPACRRSDPARPGPSASPRRRIR